MFPFLHTTGVAKAVVSVILSVIHSAGRLTTASKAGRFIPNRKEMFYLTTHSTHFIYGYMASDMVKDHSDSEKGNSLPPHRLLLSINSKGYFICTILQTR